MRCPNCGQRLADEAGRCPVCGTVIDEETRRQAMNEDDFASSSFEGTRQSMGEQASAAQSGRTDQMAPDEKRYPARPMKWYKFLIYFSLVLTGFANIWTGVEAVGDAVRDEESGSTGLCCLSGASCVGYYLRCAVDSVGGLCADCPPVSGRI